MNEIIGLGYEEYWGEEYKCPYCGEIDMLGDMNFCPYCGKSIKKFKFIEKKKRK